MKTKRLFFLKAALIIVIFLGFFYTCFLYVVPKILNSERIRNKAESYIKNKTKLNLDSENLVFHTYPDLRIGMNADLIYLNNENKKDIFRITKPSLFFDLKKLKFNNIDIDYIYIDEYELKNLLPQKSSESKSFFDFNTALIPDTHIKNVEIWVDKQSINSIFIVFDDINITKDKENKVYCTFKADLISNMLKNLVHTGENGFLYLDNDGLHAQNFEIIVGFPKLNVNGMLLNKQKQNNFSIQGTNLPVDDIETSLLYFLKKRKQGKQFLENFTNFGGTIDVDLTVKDLGLYGKCKAEDLSANSTLFNVPILFKKVFFEFNDRTVSSKATGTLGGEPVTNIFKLTGMATDLQEVTGHVNSFITNKLTSKYIPKVKIDGGADVSVDYKVKNHKINVDYLVKLKQNSEIIYKNSYLGITDKTRRILVNTLKDGDKLYINHYDYSLLNDGKLQQLISGDGLLNKKNGHLTPDYINCKTNGFVPVTLAGSFGKVIDGGYFDGDLRYDYTQNKVTGDFTIKDTRYKNFYVTTAKVLADENIINIEADGKFKSSPFKCNFDVKNQIDDSIYVYEMYLELEKFVINTAKTAKTVKSGIDKQIVNKIQEKAKDFDITIEKWTIKINEIRRGAIALDNVLLTGSLNNNLFSFSMPHVYFAKGTLCANGIYNIKDLSAEIKFSAHKIDSNAVATTIFELPNQIAGTADAELFAKAQNNFERIQGSAKFKITQGYLPKLGNTEFIIKKSKKVKREFKFKIQDIINVEVKNVKALASDLEGSFDVTNEAISNIVITSKQKYLSLLIEGDYNLDNNYADLNMYGKYNKAEERKIKILFVPLSWIVRIIFKPEHTFEKYKHKLKNVPSIKADEDDEHAFRVKVNGDLNSDNLYVEMRRIIK